MRAFDALLLPLFLAACAAPTPPPPEREPAKPTNIEERSYNLGSIGAFAEVGRCRRQEAGSERSHVTPGDGRAHRRGGEDRRKKPRAFLRETDFLTTDLFPAEITDGKHVLLIYRGSVKDD